MTPLELTVIVRAVLFLAVLVIVLRQIKHCKRWGEPLSWAIAMVHGLVYSVAFLIDYNFDNKVNGQFYNYWAVAWWIHFLIVLLSIEYSRLKRMGDKDGC